jgi:GT2 family glycosyltransferase
MSVAVVILNYNGQNYLERFLPSVEAGTHPDFAVIVADNRSTDGSLAWLAQRGYRPYSVRAWEQGERRFYLALEDNFGFAEGYNRALARIRRCQYYVLLNSDVEVPSGWLEPVIDLLDADPTVGACQPKIHLHARPGQFEYSGAAGGWIDILGYPFCRGRMFETLEEDLGQYDDPAEVFWASGAAMFVRAELYHALGGFDGDYFAHMEEIDLCWRIKRAGYKVMVCPQSNVWHIGGGTLPKVNSHKTFLNFRNSLTSVLKNAPKRWVLAMVLARLVLDGVAGARFLVRGEWGNIWAIVRAHFSFYGKLPQNLRKRILYKRLIKKHGLSRPPVFNEYGMYRGSIVWAYYAKGHKRFSELCTPARP